MCKCSRIFVKISGMMSIVFTGSFFSSFFLKKKETVSHGSISSLKVIYARDGRNNTEKYILDDHM